MELTRKWSSSRMPSVSLIPWGIDAGSRSLAKAAKVLVADSWLMEHSYTRYNAVHSDFTKKGGPARHQARRWVLKLLGLDAEVSKIGRASCREECVSQCRSRWSPEH